MATSWCNQRSSPILAMHTKHLYTEVPTEGSRIQKKTKILFEQPIGGFDDDDDDANAKGRFRRKKSTQTEILIDWINLTCLRNVDNLFLNIGGKSSSPKNCFFVTPKNRTCDCRKMGDIAVRWRHWSRIYNWKVLGSRKQIGLNFLSGTSIATEA